MSVTATWELSENNDKMVAKCDEKSGGIKSRGKGGRDDNDVAVISVGGGYTNEAFKDDGEMGGPTKPHPGLPGDDSPKGKVKLSRSEKWRILKNVAAVSLAFMVQFTAFQGTANLQSSINAKEGLGTVSLSAIYAALVVSCIFVPTFLIKRLTVKWTLCLSLLCYAPYIASQFYPRFYTLVPAGVLLGLGAAPMWAAKATYLTQVAGVYAKLTDQTVDGIVVRFFGFFFLAWQTAELWGNLVSSLGELLFHTTITNLLPTILSLLLTHLTSSYLSSLLSRPAEFWGCLVSSLDESLLHTGLLPSSDHLPDLLVSF